MIDNTPVLIITYRRTTFLKELLTKVIKYGHKNIYIYSNCWDKESIDKNDVEINRKLIKDIEKEYKTNFVLNFSDNHLSVDKSITSAISWFFSHVEHGIILEDDIKITSESMQLINKGLDIFKSSDDIA